MNLIFLRHGLSEWNMLNKFTGWVDVPLHKDGIEEAEKAKEIIKDEGFRPDKVYTSYLDRAQKTAEIVSKIEYIKDWRLNERHYGSLQGLDKKETVLKYGEKKVHEWRRGYKTKPPLLKAGSHNMETTIESYSDLDIEIPLGESLEDVVLRVKPIMEIILEESLSSKLLVVAHGNSIRAMLKLIEGISDEGIVKINIPTCIPLAFNVTGSLKENGIKRIGYLGNKEDVLSATKEVELQTKINNE